MAYSIALADRIREYLSTIPNITVTEKRMFSGLAFMVNDKMCINVSGENLMCRFDPNLLEELAEKRGFLPMNMKGRQMKDYCYVEPIGFNRKEDFEFWLKLCLDFNERAKSSK
ncbi:TfoX/Sxy family protein [Pedobacter montanisoli]|uniref:TfoX/Sxy family protein n=1 Tax=Pedobacter montanisoli TaxID=2923277 RepID=A0ABS9ZTX3_9SPHI|nr:TfoX/Sxy family protein [Pedobacter montanisoli]MCJ0742040.1 TfoX/Sxy family protein [Pedobacter montanisoli]